jgi:WhiB family redox-sensing transcriptional regulator
MSPLGLVSAAQPGVGLDDWQSRGSCASSDPDSFFPEHGASDEWAKKVCSRCPVAVVCLGEALRTRDESGVWGGLGETERRRLTPEQRGSAIYAAEEFLRADEQDAA